MEGTEVMSEDFEIENSGSFVVNFHTSFVGTEFDEVQDKARDKVLVVDADLPPLRRGIAPLRRDAGRAASDHIRQADRSLKTG